MPPVERAGPRMCPCPGRSCADTVRSLQQCPTSHCALCVSVSLGHLRNRGSFPSKAKTYVFSSAVEAWRIKGTLPAGIKRPGHKTNFL